MDEELMEEESIEALSNTAKALARLMCELGGGRTVRTDRDLDGRPIVTICVEILHGAEGCDCCRCYD